MRGSRGPAVRRLQEHLDRAGYDPGVPDGVFGPGTEASVRALQAACGLEPDGIVGERTTAALTAVISAESVADPAAVDESVDPDDEVDAEFGDGEAPARSTTFPDYFDNWDGVLARQYRKPFYLHKPSRQILRWKGRPLPVAETARTHVCLHITAVTFGISEARRRTWTRRCESGELPDGLLQPFGYLADPSEAIDRLALHERFWKVPYHWVGLLNGDILFNNPTTAYTYHGNRANAYSIGVAAEAVLPARESGRTARHTIVDQHFIETNRQTLRRAIAVSTAQGAPISHATAHRCFSMKRAGDPGEAYWKHVALPVCREMDVAIDYDLIDGGRPIPHDWDPAARHDWRGKRLDG